MWWNTATSTSTGQYVVLAYLDAGHWIYHKECAKCGCAGIKLGKQKIVCFCFRQQQLHIRDSSSAAKTSAGRYRECCILTDNGRSEQNFGHKQTVERLSETCWQRLSLFTIAADLSTGALKVKTAWCSKFQRAGPSLYQIGDQSKTIAEAISFYI